VRRLISYCLGLILWLPGKIVAQHVLYTEPIRARSGIQFQVVGKSENFYWAAKLQKEKIYSRHSRVESTGLLGFILFDARLSPLREEGSVYFPGTGKQWLMTGKNGLDQLLLSVSADKTQLICKRFYNDALKEKQIRIVDTLPFNADPSSSLLVRSEDHSKILFVAFENSDEYTTRVHAILFDAEWNPIYHRVIAHSLFAQPCIQEDEISFPGESFDDLPIKLANNGEWLMAAPSRMSRNFTVFHACANGSEYQFRELLISPFYKMEDIAMSIDNEKQEMSVGLLSRYLKTSLKNVQVTNYSITQGRFDFDTSYRFNTQVRGIPGRNLSHERFIAIPGGGYLLLKEYGIPFESTQPETPFIGNWEAAYLLANYTETKPDKTSLSDGYHFNRGLSPIPLIRNRGDLNLFYFPAISKDSTWSGSMIMEQQAESNNPDLSYLIVPDKDKLYIIYNNAEGSGSPIATNTTLNWRGQPTGDGLVFWKMNKLLNFQQAHHFASDEIAIPYIHNQQNGFAIIRLP
jgi:hypothetical protein